MNYLLVAKADESRYLIRNNQEENKLNDFYSAMNWGLIPENNNLGKFFSF